MPNNAYFYIEYLDSYFDSSDFDQPVKTFVDDDGKFENRNGYANYYIKIDQYTIKYITLSANEASVKDSPFNIFDSPKVIKYFSVDTIQTYRYGEDIAFENL